VLTVNEAFRKFRTNLELTEREQADASRRQKEIREVVNSGFKLEADFLTGSYKRWTKTKPLKDVDIFCVLHDDERPKYRREKHPSVVLEATVGLLTKKYGASNVKLQRRSVSVCFPVGRGEEKVMSFDVVPAFTKGNHYEIPDTVTSRGWTETNPKIHEEKATEANKAFDGEWKGIVRMAKAWNREKGKPIQPSFLIEVMALQILRPKFGGEYPREFMGFFATAADRIGEDWLDPAGLGPPVSDSMDQNARASARTALRGASNAIRAAMNLSASGQNGAALRAYRELFGDYFPLS
jgi:hypothetical protein